MKKAHIVYAKRSPIGKWGGALSGVRTDDLLAFLLADAVASCPLEAGAIDDIIIGCTNQAGEDNRNVARMASLLAHIPVTVPAVTLNRLCASGLDGVIDAWGRLNLGLGHCFLAGGLEGMTRAPLVISKGSRPFGRDSVMYDSTFGWRFPNPKMEALFPLLSMGETAERLAQAHGITRQRQDAFALLSHRRTLASREEFRREILPIPLGKGEFFKDDEGPREGTSLEKLAKLKPAFREGGTVTAGNSSPLSDGAALVVLASDDFTRAHGLKPLATLTGASVVGVHPNEMGLGPVAAVGKLAQDPGSFDVVELNEAFGAQVLCCMDQMNLDEDKVNLRGGAVALGHPLGCSGTRILVTLVHLLEQKNLESGLATLCVGLGQGVALSVRRFV